MTPVDPTSVVGTPSPESSRDQVEHNRGMKHFIDPATGQPVWTADVEHPDGWRTGEPLPLSPAQGDWRNRDPSVLWHNCIVHPVCGLIWAFAPKAEPARLRAFADRWHDRTAPDV